MGAYPSNIYSRLKAKSKKCKRSSEEATVKEVQYSRVGRAETGVDKTQWQFISMMYHCIHTRLTPLPQLAEL